MNEGMLMKLLAAPPLFELGVVLALQYNATSSSRLLYTRWTILTIRNRQAWGTRSVIPLSCGGDDGG